MGQNQAKFKFPTFGAIKSLRTLQEIPLCTLGQIQETYAYFHDSPYVNQLSLDQKAFEDVFGALFQDSNVHYPTFQRIGTTCSTMEIFLLVILFCDASLTQKLRLICDIHAELRVIVRLDALQLVIYRILSAMPILFKIEVPSREEVYTFVEASIRQYHERSLISEQDTTNTISEEKHQTITLDFKNLWQWCQDVHQVSTYLDSIQKICQTITSRVDRSYKGRSWIARNSFFSSSHLHRSQMMGSLMSALNAWSAAEATMEKVILDRPVIWQYTFQDLSRVHCDLWLNDGPTLSGDVKLFAALEHLILSKQHVLPVYRQTAAPPSFASSNASSSIGQGRSIGGHHKMSNAFSPSPLNTGGGNVAAPKGRETFASSNLARGVDGNGFFSSKQEAVLFTTFDHMTLLSFLLESCPVNVFQSLRSEDERRLSKRLSYDFSATRNVEEDTVVEDDASNADNDDESDGGTAEELLAANPESPKYKPQQDDGDEKTNEEIKDEARDLDSRPLTSDIFRSNPVSPSGKASNSPGAVMENEEGESDVRLVLPSHMQKKGRQRKEANSSKPWQLLGESLGQTTIENIFLNLRSDILQANSTSGATQQQPHRDSILRVLQPVGRQPQQMQVPFHIKQTMMFRMRHTAVSQFGGPQRSGGSRSNFRSPVHLSSNNSNPPPQRIPALPLPSFSMNHHVYNAILAIAQGHRHIPVFSVVDHVLPTSTANGHPYHSLGLGPQGGASKLLHIVSDFEVASFLLEHYDEFFGALAPSARTTEMNDVPSEHIFARHFQSETLQNYVGYRPLYFAGIMRKPVVVGQDVNLASAWLTMLTASLDSILVTDHQDKVCGVLTARHVENLWWRYKVQHAPMSNFDDLVKDYANGVYNVYDVNAFVPTTQQSLTSMMQVISGGGSSQSPPPNIHNFTSFSILMQALRQCEQINLHLAAFEDFIVADDADARLMLFRWMRRLSSDYSGQDLHEQSLHSADDASVATNTHFVHPPSAGRHPFTPNDGTASTRNDLATNMGRAFFAEDAKSSTSGGRTLQPQRPRDPPPSTRSAATTSSVPSAINGINNSNVGPQTPGAASAITQFSAAPPQSAASAGTVPSTAGANGGKGGGRAQRNQAAHRQREKLKDQSRLKVIAIDSHVSRRELFSLFISRFPCRRC